MSSSNTEENRSQSFTNQPCVIGYPVQPSVYVTLGVPVAQTSAWAPDSATDIQVVPARGANNSNNNNNDNNNAGGNRNNLNSNSPAAASRNNNVNRNRTRGPSNNNNVDDASGGEKFCGTLICWVVIIFLVLLIDNLSRNKFPQFRIDSMEVSPLNISSSQGAAEWTVGITASNANKHISIAYKRFDVYFFHQMDSYLCKTTIPPFHQGHKNQTELIAKAQGNLHSLGGDSIEAAIAKNKDGIVNLGLGLLVRGRYLHSIFRPGSIKKLVCTGVKVKFSPNATEGTMLGGPTECVIYH